MKTPRMRMFAGPNGSGKSTLLDSFTGKFFSLPQYQNPDKIEAELRETGKFDFGKWDLKVDRGELAKFLLEHPLGAKLADKNPKVEENILITTPPFEGGYFVSVLCDFMRRRWLQAGKSFAFETVMSSADKVSLIETAKNSGYRTYLYYICTDSAIINQERVAVRVQQGGHGVEKSKIASRYERSLSLLPGAIIHCSRAYIFDNSGQYHELIAE